MSSRPHPSVISYPSIDWQNLHVQAISQIIHDANKELVRRRAAAIQTEHDINAAWLRQEEIRQQLMETNGGWPLRPS